MNIPATLRDFAVSAYQLFTSPATGQNEPPHGAAFAFGDPEPVLQDRIADYLGVFVNVLGNYYLPPVSLEGLAKCEMANAQHGAILRFKRNMVARWFRPSKLLGIGDLRDAALDRAVFGACYFQIIYNRLGGIMALKRRPAMTMRRGIEPGVFYELQDYRYYGNAIEYLPGEIVCLMETDVKQTIYGVPEYLGGIQSVLLSEDATLFRRKFFKNGSHLGYVFVTQDAGLGHEAAKQIEEKISASRGPGNFRSMYMNIPRTSAREPVKVIPIGDIRTNDDFAKVKGITREECLAMHRMQPGISGIIPDNMTGFGDLEKVMRVYCELEVPPMQHVFLQLNDFLPRAGQISFDAPTWASA